MRDGTPLILSDETDDAVRPVKKSLTKQTACRSWVLKPGNNTATTYTPRITCHAVHANRSSARRSRPSDRATE